MGNDTKVMLFALGIATSIGALTGLGLSFTALSPLVMGGIVASVVAALFTRRMIYSQNFSKEWVLVYVLQALQFELVLLQLQLLFSLV